MWGSPAVVWAICFFCVQPAVFPWSLNSRSNGDRPRPALEALAGEVECFSDYMTLQVPRSHVEGLRQWLGRILHLPGTRRGPARLDSVLAKCGYLLHPAPAPEGDFVFRALYSACLVQKEKANYRLEIRIFQKGVKRLEQSDRYVMKCPAIPASLGQQSVLCGPTFIQVSRPLPSRSDSGRSPWLLSLRGELVASLEDASLMELYVDINATTITVQSLRQDLLQRQEVLNTSVELLPLWLVSGYHAYSLEAACPPVSSQPESEVFVHIPKQRLGLVKRGSRIEESLSLKFLRVHQSDTFTVSENRDFVVVSIPAAALLRVQPCQEAQGTWGTQAFYRVDLSLGFAETAAPVLWTMENFFQCGGSGAEVPVSIATPRMTASLPSPGPETPPSGTLSATPSQSQNARLAAWEGPPWGPARGPPAEAAKQASGPVPQTARPAGGSWAPAASLLPRTTHDGCGPRAPSGKAGSPPPPPASATLSLEPLGAARAGPRPSHPAFPDPTSLTARLSSDIASLRWPPWRSKVLLGSEPSVPLTEGPGTARLEQDPAQPPGGPLLLGGGDVATTKPIPGEPTEASEGFQPLSRSLVASLAEEALIFRHSPGVAQETPSIMETERPPQSAHGIPMEEARGLLDQSPQEPSQDTEGLGVTLLLGTDAIFTTLRGRQPDTSARLGISGPEPPRKHRMGSAAPPKALLESPQASTPGLPAAGGSDRASDVESAPKRPVGWHERPAAHTASPPPPHTPSLLAAEETTTPSLAEPGNPFPAGQGASPEQEPTEAPLATSPETPRPPELQPHVEGISEGCPCRASLETQAAGTLLARTAPVTSSDPVLPGSLAQKPSCG